MAKRITTGRKTAEATSSVPRLTAFCVNPAMPLRLVPASSPRPWMDATDSHFANRCLPLLIANQSGWFVLSSHALRVTWHGADAASSLQVESLGGEGPCPAVSHFGYGILTWHLPYLFRTPPGYNLLARGPANWPKDGISALEGVIETDWLQATFTMNWKVTRAEHPIIFAVGEPIAMLVPFHRGDLEAFEPEIRDLGSDPEIQEGYGQWSSGRAHFNAALRQPDSDAVKERWQKDYFRGIPSSGEPFAEHQTKLAIKEFSDRREGSGQEVPPVADELGALNARSHGVPRRNPSKGVRRDSNKA